VSVVRAVGAEEAGCVWAGSLGMMACERHVGAVAAHFGGGCLLFERVAGQIFMFLCKEGSYILYPAHIMLLIKSLTVGTVPNS